MQSTEVITSILESLLEKVRAKKATSCVLGLGRVGLPLSAVFANRGLKVIGIDINEERLQSIKNSKCPFYDPHLQEHLEKALKSGNLTLQRDLRNVEHPIDVIIVTVGTPTIDNSIDYSQVYSALKEISTLDLKGKMVIFRSTMPAKTTEEIIIPFLENSSSLKCGVDFGVAMCPERILEGKAMQELHELPEIIGGFNKICNDIAAELFLILNPKKVMLYTTPTGAELAKLFANIFRYSSFALANEFAVWAEKYGLDATELIKIVNYNYPRGNIPIPGFVGGPCLSKDGTFLSNDTPFTSIISAAWKLNESIPQHIVNNVKSIVAGNLFNKKISVLGISFKAGSDDLRNSPSVKLVEILKANGANVSVHDPFVKGTMSLLKVLKSPDIVILATNHKEFHDIAQHIRNSGCKIIYDVWGMYREEDFPNIRYAKFGKSLNSTKYTSS